MRCIECEEIELARVRDQRPGQTLPIPHAALDGFPAGRTSRDLTRRRLLQWGVAGFASVYAAKELGFEQVWEAVANAQDAPMQKAIVVLYLAGGNDGLNVLVPNDSADYLSYVGVRPSIHRLKGPSTAERVGSTALRGPGGAALAFANVTVSKNGGGDNSAPRFNFTGVGGDGLGFDSMFGDGTGGAGSDLAIMPAVDAKQYNLSHFDNSDIWFRASNDVNIKTGWLGRWLEHHGSDVNPLQAISIDTALSKSIRTSAKPVSAISSLPMNGFRMNSTPYGGVNDVVTPSTGRFDVNVPVQTLAGFPAPDNAYLSRSRSTYGLTVETYNQLIAAGTVPANTLYPNTGTLSTRLRTAAHLLAANLGTRVITIHWGSFDTHTGQVVGQDRQLAELSRALAAFKADLTARGIEQNVTTLVFSEFGRRVKENGTGDTAGTDHGAGGLMMASGSGVRGGFAADWPGCEINERVPANDNQGNLKVPTDYRSVYKAVIEEWFGHDAEPVIGGPAIETLVRGDGFAGTKRLFK